MSSKYFKYVDTGRSGIKNCGIKPNNYSSRIPQILEMVAIAKEDFPFLKDEDIHTVAYDGDRWKRQTGIEFQVPDSTTIPEGWNEVGCLEYVFAGN